MAQKELSLHITGMTCAACSSRVEKVLNKMDAVEAQVNLATESAKVQYDQGTVTPEDSIGKIEKIGYGVEVEKEELDITGRTGAACSSRVERVLSRMPGVEAPTVNLASESASGSCYAGMVDEADIIGKVANLGYSATVNQSKEDQRSKKEQELQKKKRTLIISAILSVPLLITMLDHLFGMTLPEIFMNPWFQFALATPVQ